MKRIARPFRGHLTMSVYAAPVFVLIVLLSSTLFCQSQPASDKAFKEKDNESIIQYIESKGPGTIVFDSTNIKRFWIDKSVYCREDSIIVSLNKINSSFDSVKYRVQLDHVLENQSCNIEILSINPDVSFNVYNSSSKLLSTSSSGPDFILYHTYSATLNLEDTKDFSFYLQFLSKVEKSISIAKIILSFSENKKSVFRESPGFNTLMNLFEEKGMNVVTNNPLCKDVRLLSLEKSKVLFLRIPEGLAHSKTFYYHTIPFDKKDLLPDRVKYSFNNYDKDLNVKDRTHIEIPKPYSAKSDYIIMQIIKPSYPCIIQLGQFQNREQYWSIEIRQED